MRYYDHRLFFMDIRASKKAQRDVLSKLPTPDPETITKLDHEIAVLDEAHQLWNAAEATAVVRSRHGLSMEQSAIPPEVQAELEATTLDGLPPVPPTHSEFLRQRRASVVGAFEGLLASHPDLQPAKEFLTAELRFIADCEASISATGDRQLAPMPPVALAVPNTSNTLN